MEHECEKADQRMRTDAVRQPVMNGCDFDFDVGGREIGCVGQQRQLSVEDFGTRDCLFIKTPAKSVNPQVRLDESAQFRLGNGPGESVIGPAIRSAPSASGLPFVLSVELDNHLLRLAFQFPDTGAAAICLHLGPHRIMRDNDAMIGENAFRQARIIEGKTIEGFG